jgi:hypothetical protein
MELLGQTGGPVHARSKERTNSVKESVTRHAAHLVGSGAQGLAVDVQKVIDDPTGIQRSSSTDVAHPRLWSHSMNSASSAVGSAIAGDEGSVCSGSRR